MNGWFPKISISEAIASGNNGIWITDILGSRQVSSVGIGPIWAGNVLIYNRNDNTTQIGNSIIPIAYNDYVGSDDTRWAGFVAGEGRVDYYTKLNSIGSIKTACNPRLSKDQFGYLTPYQANYRNLILNDKIFASGAIMDFQLGDDPSQCVWMIATGTYTRSLLTQSGKIDIRDDEAPIKVFTAPDNKPWIVTQTRIEGGVTFIRPFDSPFGYFISGILMFPSVRMINGRLRVCGSDDRGNALFNNYIDFSKPRVDLRLVGNIEPPKPPKPPKKPPIEPPKEPPVITKPPIPPQKKAMIPSISDDQIIELSEIYDLDPKNPNKDNESYSRDAAYYGYGYIRLRISGNSHSVAAAEFKLASSVDDYYNPTPAGMLTDDLIIDFNKRFISRYSDIGRYQQQSRKENARDLIYWEIVYARNIEAGLSHENSLRQMENGMAQEAGLPLPYPPPPISKLHVDGRLFRDEQNEIFRWKGVTAFKLCNLYEQGQSINSFLSAFSGYNILRIFLYTPKSIWGDNSWDLPSSDKLIEFCNYVGSKGFYVEVCCITDNDALKVSQVKNLISSLNSASLNNIFLEAVNEPFIHDKIDPAELKNALSATNYLYTSGVYQYEFLNKFYGKYSVNHSDRNAEWPRKAKDSEDLFQTLHCPVIEDEPIAPESAAFNELDFYTYAALSSLMGSGATFHFHANSQNMPDDNVLACSKAFLEGLNVYSLDAQLRDYEHLRDLEKVDSNGTPTTCLRAFRKGNYAIIIRNKSVDIPSSWVALDDKKVAFKIL